MLCALTLAPPRPAPRETTLAFGAGAAWLLHGALMGHGTGQPAAGLVPPSPPTAQCSARPKEHPEQGDGFASTQMLNGPEGLDWESQESSGVGHEEGPCLDEDRQSKRRYEQEEDKAHWWEYFTHNRGVSLRELQFPMGPSHLLVCSMLSSNTVARDQHSYWCAPCRAAALCAFPLHSSPAWVWGEKTGPHRTRIS